MINGAKIRLRPLERDDIPRFVAWFADPEVREGLALHLPMSLPQEEHWFEDTLKYDRNEQPLAIDAQTAEGWLHIGSCGFHEIDWRNRYATLGIAIGDKRYWSQGFGTDAINSHFIQARLGIPTAGFLTGRIARRKFREFGGKTRREILQPKILGFHDM